MPRVACEEGPVEVNIINNVIFDWDLWGTHIGPVSTGIEADLIGKLLRLDKRKRSIRRRKRSATFANP